MKFVPLKVEGQYSVQVSRSLNRFLFWCQVCSLLRGSLQGLDSAPRWLQQSWEALCTDARPPGVSLYLCHGALAMLSWKGALPGPQWEQLLLLVPDTLLALDVRYWEVRPRWKLENWFQIFSRFLLTAA